MAITWDSFERTGQSVTAMHGARRVGQVVRYDRPAGWAAFHGGDRVPGGPWATRTEAMEAFEDYYERMMG